MGADQLDPGLDGQVGLRVGQQGPQPLGAGELAPRRRDITRVQGHAGLAAQTVALLQPGLIQQRARSAGQGPGWFHWWRAIATSDRFAQYVARIASGRYPDVSRDFIGQGAANVIAGIFRGMPVGGSVSASSLNKAAGARSRMSLMIASVVMAVVIIAFAGLVGYIAMPALAGLLILVGYRTIKPADLQSVWKTGAVQKAVLVTSFVLTMVIPLQYAVLVAVGLSVILHVVRQSNQVTIKRWLLDPDGNLIETDPPAQLPANEVVALQPYGSLFFAAAPVLETQLPATDGARRNSVVILRLRGRTDLGTTFMDVLHRYAQALTAADSKLVIVSASERIQEQLRVTGVTGLITPQNIYSGDERVAATLKRAYADAMTWIEQNQLAGETDQR